jgi:hypothetical protein
VFTVRLSAGRTAGERAPGVVLALNAASAVSVALMLCGEPALVAYDVAPLASKAATLTEATGVISIMKESKLAPNTLVVFAVLVIGRYIGSA